MKNLDLKPEFQKIEDELNGAYERNDLQKINELLSDHWSILETSTGLSNKEQFTKAIEQRKLVQSKMKKEVKEVKLFDNLAIVISKGINEGQYQNTPYHSEQWVTNIFIKEKANWICVMTQEVPVNCENN